MGTPRRQQHTTRRLTPSPAPGQGEGNPSEEHPLKPAITSAVILTVIIAAIVTTAVVGAIDPMLAARLAYIASGVTLLAVFAWAVFHAYRNEQKRNRRR